MFNQILMNVIFLGWAAVIVAFPITPLSVALLQRLKHFEPFWWFPSVYPNGSVDWDKLLGCQIFFIETGSVFFQLNFMKNSCWIQSISRKMSFDVIQANVIETYLRLWIYSNINTTRNVCWKIQWMYTTYLP